MANILFLSLVFAPDGVSTSILMTELALELQALGHTVTVLTTTPHYNVDAEARKQQSLTRRWGGWLYQSTYHGISIYHARIPEKGTRVGARMLDYLRFHLISTIAGLILTDDVDLIFAPSPPLTIGINAWILSLCKRAPFIYNVQEIYPDVAVSLGVIKNKLIIRLMMWMERFIYNKATKITVISAFFRRRLLDKGVAGDKLHVIPNFVDTTFVQPGEKVNPFAEKHDLLDRFVVLYAGNIGLTQGFETFLEATVRLQHLPDICFLIVGDGARSAWLAEQIADLDSPNITFLPYQERSLVPQIYASSDVCLVPLKKGTAVDTFPSKIYTIMAAGRPVIASADADSELSWVVNQAQCGWAVLPDRSAALTEVIEQAYHHRECLSEMGRNGRSYVEAHHSRKSVALQYIELFEEITSDR